MPLTPRQASRLAKHILEAQGGDEVEAIARGEGEDDGGTSPLPQRVGGYLIRRLIAAGGMGVVYEAEQQNPRRTVAVKVMSRQFAARGRAALRRFEYEAQLLAHLDHAGIAKIYEAGTWDDGTGGVPYFVMEFIPDARTIIQFANAHDLSRRQRLQLFAKVCDAAHHGHQKGIIHRDLKPANIIVPEPAGDDREGATADETPQPKIIDFGVARAADTDISVTTMHTKPGDIVGTLQYMSPE
jgi:non-specific serine/threonine protein kinase/serine/threonine-protein kinase